MGETSIDGAIHGQSSGERPNRTKRNRAPPPLSPRDLISDLPDAVIHHIFSFLPLEDVVKTSHLSKRWRSTWTTTTHLIFDGSHGVRSRYPDTYTFDFPSFIDSVLMRCTSPTVKRFHIVYFKYDEACRPKLDHWLRFAASRLVEDLRLWVVPRISCILPRFLYCLNWLVRLEGTNCCFSLGTTIKWPHLKVLLIQSAELSDDILERIFRGSPVLESLVLQECKGLKEIVIDSRSVKELVLSQSMSSSDKLWAPHLLSLQISGYWHSLFRIEDISSLVEAELYFFVCGNKRMIYDFFEELFKKLREVPTITIGFPCLWCLQILSLWEVEGVPSPLSKCQNLTLHAPVSQWDLPGIAYLLQSSPCLEKLVIHLTGLSVWMFMLDEESEDRFNFDEEDFLCSRKGNFECLAKHLKRVEIIGFGANHFRSKHLLALIKFLLRDALVLEKLIIKAELPTRHGQTCYQAAVLLELLGVSQNVLSYRRASQNAEVIFNHSFKEVSF